MTAPPAPSIARILRHVAVIALFADVLLFVVAVALGGVEGDVGALPGPLWLWLSSGTGWMVLVMRGLLSVWDNAGRGARVPGSRRRSSTLNFLNSRDTYPRPHNRAYPARVLSSEGRFYEAFGSGTERKLAGGATRRLGCGAWGRASQAPTGRPWVSVRPVKGSATVSGWTGTGERREIAVLKDPFRGLPSPRKNGPGF